MAWRGRAVLQSLPARKRKEAVSKMAMSLIRGSLPVVYYTWFNEWRGKVIWFYAFSEQTKQRDRNTHTRPHKSSNLLDHINFFPSKEEGRIPGERKVLSERKTKWDIACVCVQGKSFLQLVQRKSMCWNRNHRNYTGKEILDNTKEIHKHLNIR